MPPNDPARWNRRDFLARAAKAGLSVAAASAAGLWLHDRNPPAPPDESEGQVELPDFSLPDRKGLMAIVQGTDRAACLRSGLDALGGIGRFIRPGDQVLLKVNAAFASAPLIGATTHPDLVSALARLCFDAGAKRVRVTDNPINDPDSSFRLTGIGRAAEEAGAELAFPKPAAFRPTTVRGGRFIRDWPLLHEPFAGVTKLIGIAPVKDHFRSGASMTLKNWYGLLGGRRNLFHQNVHGLIRELAILVRPTFVVLDGIESMLHNGPTGGSLEDLRPTRTLIISTDGVAADAFGATLLERRAADLPYLGLAMAAGAGTVDYESLRPLRLTASAGGRP